ncbi:MAG: hypothetical protein ISS23_01450 [Nanoarchaeota archaeon]|nr:hypothetical protein [Nanoarchaeota archaeon]
MEQKDYPLSILEAKVNSVDVTIIGIRHKAKFFEKYKYFFEEKISHSDALILEDSGKKFWEGKNCFRKIGKIAQYHKKKVYHADSNKCLSAVIDLMQGVQGIALIAVGVKLGILGNSMSTLGYASVGTYLFFGSLPGRIVRYICHGKNAKYGLDNLLLYGHDDYRETLIAGGINKLCRKNKGLKKIVCFHGDGHSKPIRTYLKHPILRKIKKLAYLPYHLLSNRRVREYVHDGESWKLERRI